MLTAQESSMGLLDQGAGAGAPVVPGLAQAAAAAGAPGPAQPQGAPPTAPQGAPPTAPQAAPTGGGGGGEMQDMDLKEEQASPEEQKEYERAMKAVSKVLYGNEKTSNAIVDQVNPEDKIDSTAKVTMLFIQQLDKKVDLDENVVAEITQESTARIMELAETRHGMQYSDQESQAILGPVWVGISLAFGAGEDEQGHQEMVKSVGADNLGPLKQNYEAALNG